MERLRWDAPGRAAPAARAPTTMHSGRRGLACVDAVRAVMKTRLRMPTTWGHNLNPNALLTVFMEVYLPYGFCLNHAAMRGMCRPAKAIGGGELLRLRDPTDIVLLPARTCRSSTWCRGGTRVMRVIAACDCPLKDLVTDFHKLLLGLCVLRTKDSADGDFFSVTAQRAEFSGNMLIPGLKRDRDLHERLCIAIDARCPAAVPLLPHEAAAPPYSRFDADEHVASMVMNYLHDYGDRLALECVGTVGASEREGAHDVDLKYISVYQHSMRKLFGCRDVTITLYALAWRSAGTSAPGAWELDVLALSGYRMDQRLTDERLTGLLRRAGTDVKTLVVQGAPRFTGSGLVKHVEYFLENFPAPPSQEASGRVFVVRNDAQLMNQRVIHPPLWQLEHLDVRLCYGVCANLIVEALLLAGIHNRPKECRLNALFLGECQKLSRDVLLGVDNLVRHERLVESPFYSQGVDIYGCAQCDDVTTQGRAIVCKCCQSVSCKAHAAAGEGKSLCSNAFCNAYVCLAGDCIQNADVALLDLTDVHDEIVTQMCDDCELIVCTACFEKDTEWIDSDKGEPYYRDNTRPAFIICAICGCYFCNQTHTDDRCSQRFNRRDNFCFCCDQMWCEDCVDNVTFVRCAGKGGDGKGGTVHCAKKYCDVCAYDWDSPKCVQCVVCRAAFCNGAAPTQFSQIDPQKHRVDYEHLSDCKPINGEFKDVLVGVAFTCDECVGRVVNHVDNHACAPSFMQKCVDGALETNFRRCTGSGCRHMLHVGWCAHCTPNVRARSTMTRTGGFVCPDCASSIPEDQLLEEREEVSGAAAGADAFAGAEGNGDA